MHMDAVFGHDDVSCSYQIECMYIHYELCILRFYETCLGLMGFSMLGLSVGHGQRIWVVIGSPKGIMIMILLYA